MLETTKNLALKGWLALFVYSSWNELAYNSSFYRNKLNFTVIIARDSDNSYAVFQLRRCGIVI